MHPKAKVIDALIAYRKAAGITGDDLIQVAAPGEAKWEEWAASGSGMEGDPETAVVALRVEGFGAFYASAEEAIGDLEQYFMQP